MYALPQIKGMLCQRCNKPWLGAAKEGTNVNKIRIWNLSIDQIRAFLNTEEDLLKSMESQLSKKESKLFELQRKSKRDSNEIRQVKEDIKTLKTYIEDSHNEIRFINNVLEQKMKPFFPGHTETS
jgi:peptidoglycan hydrolase CwlO-like protein